MAKFIAIIYIISLHLIVGLFLVKSDVIQRVESKLGMSQGQKSEPELTRFFYDMVHYHSRMDGSVPDGSVIFIGDSIIQSLYVAAIVNPSVNYGIGGDTTIGVLQRISTYESINRASAVVVAIGLNDMKFRSDEEIIQNYKAIVERIPGNVSLIFSAILPIDTRVLADSETRNQRRIKEINSSLEKLAKESKNIFFVNAGELLVDSNGNLASGFHGGDGVHLNSKGYSVFINFFIEKFHNSVCESTDCTGVSLGYENGKI